jgi:hypothetical protein
MAEFRQRLAAKGGAGPWRGKHTVVVNPERVEAEAVSLLRANGSSGTT